MFTCKCADNISYFSLKYVISLELEQCDKGSTFLDIKAKSLQKRWFTKEGKPKNKIQKITKRKYNKRKSFIEIIFKMGEGNKKLVTLGHFQVLINFDKHYNKWKICEENNHP